MTTPGERGRRDRAPESVGHAAARVLGGQLEVIRRAHGALEHGSHPDALHALRVALRRVRAGLRFFPVPRVPAGLDGWLDLLTTRLGPVRDLDVWLAFLESERLPSSGAADPLVDSARRDRDRQARALRARLHAAPWQDTLAALPALVRRVSGDEEEPALRGDFGMLATPHVHGAWDRFRKRAGAVTESSPPARCHALRKAARRLRYFGEFAQPAFEPPFSAFVAQAHAIASALGSVHDMDVFAENTRAMAGPQGEELRAVIAAHRHRHWLEYRQALDALPGPGALGERLVQWRRRR